jgi:site-specific DNA recombinase
MLEKARAGIYPSYARVGYRNVDGPHGKRIIVVDPEAAPVITDLFHYFSEGKYSIKGLAEEFRLQGRTLRGRRINASLVHQILRNRLVYG